jgi:hypothetical protein
VADRGCPLEGVCWGPDIIVTWNLIKNITNEDGSKIYQVRLTILKRNFQ